jgi:large subunit ribosomal protein L9
MDVILLERVEKLGHIGDVVSVKPGFARNFLLPRGKALRATDANRARFEADRARIEADNAKRRDIARSESREIEGASLVLIRQASNTGQLYGSVAARDIAEGLSASGHKVPKAAIILDRAIKTLGIHTVRVSLHPEVSVDVKVNVARSPEEAELQAKGVDVTVEAREEEVSGFTEVFEEGVEPEAIAEDAAEASEA